MSSRRVQRGAAMIIVLFVLLAMALSAMGALRAAMNAEAQAGNLVAQTEAREAAQGALRWCERELLEEDSAVVILPAPAPDAPAAWELPSNWKGDRARAVSVVGARSGEPGSGRPPQCLAEFQAVGTGSEQVVLVTARGFSAGHAQDARGDAIAGSSVWLQSIVSLVEP